MICNSTFSLPCPLQPSFENAPPVTVCSYAQCEFCVRPLLSSRTAPALPQVGPGRADGSHRTGRAGSPSSPARPSPCPELLRGSPLGSHQEWAYGGCSVRGPGTGKGTAVLLLPGVPEASRRGIPREPSSCLGRQVPAPHLHFTGVFLSLLWPPCPSVLSSSILSTFQTSYRVWALSTEADWRGPGEKLGFTGSWGS